MEFATVRFFDGRNDKRFGFAGADKDGANIFFHLNTEGMLADDFDGNGPSWREYKFNHDHAIKHGYIPRKGHRIIFERVNSPKGPRAAKWSKSYSLERNVRPYHGPQHQNATLLHMTVVWDIVEITFTDKDFPADSLFGDMETRTRALMTLKGFIPLDDEFRDIRYHCGHRTWGYWGEKRTFRFKVYANMDHSRFIDLSVGRNLVESVRYDDLTRIRHARHWELPDTASLEEIIQRHDEHHERMME